MESTVKPMPEFYQATIRSLFAQVASADNGCWEWIGYRDRDGYGVAKVNRERYRAHRVFYSAFVGDLEADMVLDHICRNTSCVNPRHLEQVTVKTNTLRGSGPSAENAMVTHCPQGHEYSPDNTYVDPTGRRHCVKCSRTRTQDWRASKVRRQRTHCKNGHPWVDANIRVERSGVRRCSPCHEAYEANRNGRRRVQAELRDEIDEKETA